MDYLKAQNMVVASGCVQRGATLSQKIG